MGRFLLDGEEMVVAVNQHWTRVAGVTTGTVFGFVLVVLIALVTPGNVGFIAQYSFYLWLVLLAYCIIQWLLWRDEWFVATDRRLLLTYGLIWRRVAMMPMGKVTDMSFNQSFIGRFLGYGTYVMESAGQDQALRRIDFIPDAESHYRAICAEIFGKEDDGTEDSNDSHRHPHSRSSKQDDYDNYDDGEDNRNAHHGDKRRYDRAHDYYDERDDDNLQDSDDWRHRDDTDPYGVPVQRLPLRTERRRTDQRRPSGPTDDIEGGADFGDSDDADPGWYVSREDVGGPQRVRRDHDRGAGDDRA